jgi:hypothetical protein
LLHEELHQCKSPYRFGGHRHAKNSTADFNVPVEYTGPNASQFFAASYAKLNGFFAFSSTRKCGQGTGYDRTAVMVQLLLQAHGAASFCAVAFYQPLVIGS